MAKGAEKIPSAKEGTAEKSARFLRDTNILGALALGAAAVVAPIIAAPASALAGIDVLQAAGFEGARRIAKKRRTKRS